MDATVVLFLEKRHYTRNMFRKSITLLSISETDHHSVTCFQPFSAITLNSNHVMLDFGLNDRREKLINKHYLLCSQSGLSGFYFSKKRLMGLGSRI